jgi:hypothetical protein
MDIDIPDNAFSTGSNSAEPMFTPGGKRKRCFDQDEVQAQATGQMLDEGSAAKVSSKISSGCRSFNGGELIASAPDLAHFVATPNSPTIRF